MAETIREILKESYREHTAMTSYCVVLKDSVFRETPLVEAEFEEDRRLVFDSKADAEEWVADQSPESPSRGQLTLHTAHPADTSDVDAYVVFQPAKGVWRPES